MNSLKILTLALVLAAPALAAPKTDSTGGQPVVQPKMETSAQPGAKPKVHKRRQALRKRLPPGGIQGTGDGAPRTNDKKRGWPEPKGPKTRAK